MKNFDTYLIHSDGHETKIAETWTEQEAIDAADMAVSGRVDCRAVVCRTDSSALAPALYEVASVPAVEAAPIIADITKEIKYCRATRDYDCYVTIDGGAPQYIGSASTYGQGEVITNQYVFDYLMDTQTIETATELLMELPAGAFCGNDGDAGGGGNCEPEAEPKAMTTNEMIAAVKALRVGDDVTINGFTVVKYGKKNYHVFLGAAYASPTAFGSLSDAYTVAIKIGMKTSKAVQVAA